MLSYILSFISPNKWMIIVILGLSASTAIAGKLLLNAHERLGKAESSAIQWEEAKELSDKAFKKLDTVLALREQQRYTLQRQLNRLNKKLSEVKDETNCLDTTIPEPLRVLLYDETSDEMP